MTGATATAITTSYAPDMQVVRKDVSVVEALGVEEKAEGTYMQTAVDIIRGSMNKSKHTLIKTHINKTERATFVGNPSLWEIYFDDKKQVLGLIKYEDKTPTTPVRVDVINLDADENTPNALVIMATHTKDLVQRYKHPAANADEWCVIEQIMRDQPTPDA